MEIKKEITISEENSLLDPSENLEIKIGRAKYGVIWKWELRGKGGDEYLVLIRVEKYMTKDMALIKNFVDEIDDPSIKDRGLRFKQWMAELKKDSLELNKNQEKRSK